MTPRQVTHAAARGSDLIDRAGEHLPVPSRSRQDATRRRGQRAARSSDHFRGDVAGLRAVAVGLVLLFHAGLPSVPGGFVGVDVFFVISGFLITGQLVAEIDRTGRISLRGFYARRVKRILPAATVVLIATAVSVRLLVPRTRWEEIGGDIIGAATYLVNWRLADRAVDYLAEDSPPSPVQHYWSLAVEEQFYLVWPVLVLAATLLAKLIRRTNTRPILWIGLLTVAAPSFAWSIMESASSPERAFFISTTRMWELSIGAGVALMGASVARIPREVAVVIGWAGLATILTSALVVTTGTAWPGSAAALPTLGTAAVIAAGPAAGRRGPVAILGTRPFRWTGDLSYSLYLWHWPMIVLATVHWGGPSVARGVAVAVASVIPAWITFRLVENPLRHSRVISGSPRLALTLGGNFTMAGICTGLALLVISTLAVGPAPSDRYAPGAAALGTLAGNGVARPVPVPERFEFITPDPLHATKDVPDSSADGCFQQMVSAELLWCTYGNPQGTTKVAIVGDSKMDQWLPAFQLLAIQNDWKLDAAFKGACPFMSAIAIKGDDASKPYTDCGEWNTTLLRRLVAERPDYVITSQGASRAADSSGRASVEAMVAGMRSSWAALETVGANIIVIANNPHPGLNVMDCVDKNRTHLSACSFSPDRHLADSAFQTQQQAVAGTNVEMLDLFEAVCPTVECPPVMGNVLIYRIGSHITATYVRTLTPHLAEALSGIGVPVRFTPSQ